MSLKHVILVVLKKAPATGYQINKTFDGPLGFFWDTSHQRIYRALATLEKEAWVRHVIEPQADKPDKKIYQLTDAGQAELMKWLNSRQAPAPVNETLLVKLFAGDIAGIDNAIAEVEFAREHHQQQLQQYISIEQEFFLEVDSLPLEDQLLYINLRRGILAEQSRLEWANEAMARLEPLRRLS